MVRDLISVEAARERILGALTPLPAEIVPIGEAHGRVLSQPLLARRTQPPFAASAMDGYAVCGTDLAQIPARLRVIGQSAAGRRFGGLLGPGQAVRIFTGAPLPDGADTVVIQENCIADTDRVIVNEPVAVGKHIRPAGLDFQTGDAVLDAGVRLTARHIGLAAAMNFPWIPVHRKPRVAILPTGDEIVLPGDPLGPDQIVSSNSLALAAMVSSAGGVPIQLGIAADNPESLRTLAQAAAKADLLITIGGASVGDHDLVRDVLGAGGEALDFWKIAMRPGKPLMFGRYAGCPMIGLPGNPVSAIICAMLFMVPAIERLQSLTAVIPVEYASAGAPLGPNDEREDYQRATLRSDGAGRIIAYPATQQDSSMMRTLADADGLLVRRPHDDAIAVGDLVQIIRFPTGALPI